MVRNFTDQELLERVTKLPSYKGFPHGILSIWVRSKADEFNIFDDKRYLFDCNGDKPVFVSMNIGTTNAGSYYLENFDKYNKDGCAVLKSDEILIDSHHYGLHHGKPAYVEVKPFPFYRDKNKNKRAEEIGKLYTGQLIGANDHRAGYHSLYINNWSAGCLVSQTEADYLKFLAFMNKRPFLSECILKEW